MEEAKYKAGRNKRKDTWCSNTLLNAQQYRWHGCAGSPGPNVKAKSIGWLVKPYQFPHWKSNSNTAVCEGCAFVKSIIIQTSQTRHLVSMKSSLSVTNQSTLNWIAHMITLILLKISYSSNLHGHSSFQKCSTILSETILAGLGESGCTWPCFSPEATASPAPVWLQLWLCQGAFSWNLEALSSFRYLI